MAKESTSISIYDPIFYVLYAPIIDAASLCRDDDGYSLDTDTSATKYAIALNSHLVVTHYVEQKKKEFNLKNLQYPFTDDPSGSIYAGNIIKLPVYQATEFLRGKIDQDLGDRRYKLETECITFLNRIGFSPQEWLTPFLSMIVYGITPVPCLLASEGISFNFYQSTRQQLLESISNDISKMKTIEEVKGLLSYLVEPIASARTVDILLHQNMSFKGFVKRMKSKWPFFIKPYLSKLPHYHFQNISFRKFLLGTRFFIQKYYFGLNNDEILKSLEGRRSVLQTLYSINQKPEVAEAEKFVSEITTPEISRYISDIVRQYHRWIPFDPAQLRQ